MISISVCMIVKDEQAILRRCLDCLKTIADEIIIVDTGSTDETKKIALEYTQQVYDFAWVDDFSAARNFSFSKATMDYIYVADADEILDDANIHKFLQLKKVLLPEIEVVNMYYKNQLSYGTVYNFDRESRPKLYKRLRTLRWRDQIHEIIDFNPIVYDSDIEIIHAPLSNHSKRDFSLYQKIIKKGEFFSDRLIEMYARELFIAGNDEDFMTAYPFFMQLYEDEGTNTDLSMDIQCILIRCERLTGEIENYTEEDFEKMESLPFSSEFYYEIGDFYLQKKEFKKAIHWFYQAAYNAESILNIHYSRDYPLAKIAQCYEYLHEFEKAKTYQKLADESMLESGGQVDKADKT